MSFLAWIWGKILAGGVIVLGILVISARLISVGVKQEAAKANEARLKAQIKIRDALTKTREKNREDTKIEIDKAENDDWSGFNRKPGSMSDDDNPKT